MNEYQLDFLNKIKLLAEVISIRTPVDKHIIKAIVELTEEIRIMEERKNG